MARRRWSSRAKPRLLAAVLLVVLVGGAMLWWHLRHWQPDRAVYRVQGVEIGSDDGTIDWKALKATGADFAYIDASASAFARDPAFVRNLDDARAAGLQVGAVHKYDPCQPADRQAANFVTVVPRGAEFLPPAVDLDMLADNCPVAVTEAAVQSELMTFLNQIETHTGKPAILKISRRFEKRYRMAAAIDRNIWVTGDRFQPDYAGRPWTLWTANSALASAVEPEPLRWVVVQP
ncbi:MAG: glycoside hydrolase family 25 protein [Novosphingobium sp.]|nr:glycoside hydrolase family 25 protein [Novosphingobium sp.]